MTLPKLNLAFLGVASVSALVLAATLANAQQKQKSAPSKEDIEAPVKKVINGTQPAPGAPAAPLPTNLPTDLKKFEAPAKRMIEAPTKGLIESLKLIEAVGNNSATNQPKPKLDIKKTGEVEKPITTVVGDKSGTVTAEFVNPKVEPGKVKWHATFAAACEASSKSRKPVLLFQMMGKLDDQFC